MTLIELNVLILIMQAVIASPGLVALINGWLNRGKAKAEAADSLTDSVKALLDPLNERIATLEAQAKAQAERERRLRVEREEREKNHRMEIDELKQAAASESTTLRQAQQVLKLEVDELRGGVEVLIAQLEAARIVPRWRPRPRTGPLGDKP